MLLNTLTYGTARVSRSAVYVLVALWYGVSSDTDSFFLAYATVTFLVATLSATLGIILVPHLTSISIRDFVLLLGVPTLVAVVGVLGTGSSLLAYLIPYVGLAILASALSGRLTARGQFLAPPIATLLGGIATILMALGFRSFGLASIGLALSVGEFVRCLILATRTPLSRTGGLSYRIILPYLGIFALFSSAQLLTRLAASVLNEGYVTTLAYAGGGVGILISFTTTGLTATNGHVWRELSARGVLERCGESILPRLKVALLATLVGGLAGALAWHFQFLYEDIFSSSLYWNTIFGVAFILLFMLPMYGFIANVLPALIILKKIRGLFERAVGYIVLLSLGLFCLPIYFDIYGLALALVGAELFLALSLFGLLYGERKILFQEAL